MCSASSGSISSPFSSTPFSGTQVRYSAEHLQELNTENKRLAEQVAFLTAQRDAAETHAIFAMRETAVLRHQLDNRNAKKSQKSRRIHTKARVVTAEEGRAAAVADQEEKKRKQDKANAVKAKKQQVEIANQVRRATEGNKMIFVGSLKLKKKNDLEDILSVLKLPFGGTNAELVNRIHAHFDSHPELKLHPQFEGLFARPRGQKRRTASENDPESSHHDADDQPSPARRRRRLDDVTNLSSTLHSPSHPLPQAAPPTLHPPPFHPQPQAAPSARSLGPVYSQPQASSSTPQPPPVHPQSQAGTSISYPQHSQNPLMSRFNPYSHLGPGGSFPSSPHLYYPSSGASAPSRPQFPPQ